MKKYKDYLITGGIVLATFLIIFIAKKIYPFGDYTIAFSDMQAQIIDFYYHFRNTIFGNGSLLIDFNTSWGMNFFGHLVYYITSPFTLITLIVPRVDVYKCVSIITFLKFLTASLTSLYFFKYYFKKINSWGQIAISLMYTFCGFGLVLYQITMWMDMFYMFPLLVIGIKKVLDLEDTKWYLLTLVICLITSFYLTLITLIFVFLISYLYLRIIKKENTKKALVSLGLTTVLGLLISCIFLLPTFNQILSSERTAVELAGILNSKFGNLADKIHYFLYSGLSIALSIRLIAKYKEHKKEVKFFVLSMILLLIPVFVEPVNLLVHLGSYYSFPVRYNFIILFGLIVASAYYLNNYDKNELEYSLKNITYVGIVVITLFVLYHTIINYYGLQYAVYSLSINEGMTIFWVMVGAMAFVIMLFLLLPSLVPNRNRLCIYVFIFVSITSFGYAYNYIGIDKSLEFNTSVQEGYISLNQDKYREDNFAIKVTKEVNINGGNVANTPYAYSFTSLTEEQSRLNFRYLGYSLKPNVNSSVGGTYFTDTLLGYKYLIATNKVQNEYYTRLPNNYYNYYEFEPDISYGYLLDEKNIPEVKEASAFVNQNNIYKGWYDENLFDVLEFDTLIQKGTNYEAKLSIKDKRSVYLELLYDYTAYINNEINGLVDVYVNDEKIYKGFPTADDNGLLYIGTFENEEVVVKIKAKGTAEVKYFNVGVMDSSKWLKFTEEQKTPDYDIEFDRNKINIDIESNEEGKVLFIPINYTDGYTMQINGETREITKVFGNYIGIKLEKGENDIEIKFVPKGLKLGAIITIVSIILTFIIYKFKLIDKLKDNKVIGVIVSIISKVLFYGMLVLIYLIPCICFIVSFFTYIKL